MSERTDADEEAGMRRLLNTIVGLQRDRLPTGPPYISPLERRVALLEERQKRSDAVLAQLLELPTVRHSGVVTATFEEGE